MTNIEQSEDTYRARLQTAIESIRYWMPSVADAARVEESETAAFWKVHIMPRVLGACPMELMLRADRRFDIVLGGESHEDLEMIAFEDFILIAEAVTAGRIIQRRWVSRVTEAVSEVETIVELADGRVWRANRTGQPGMEPLPRDAAESRDRHFLPYRR